MHLIISPTLSLSLYLSLTLSLSLSRYLSLSLSFSISLLPKSGSHSSSLALNLLSPFKFPTDLPQPSSHSSPYSPSRGLYEEYCLFIRQVTAPDSFSPFYTPIHFNPDQGHHHHTAATSCSLQGQFISSLSKVQGHRFSRILMDSQGLFHRTRFPLHEMHG